MRGVNFETVLFDACEKFVKEIEKFKFARAGDISTVEWCKLYFSSLSFTSAF